MAKRGAIVRRSGGGSGGSRTRTRIVQVARAARRGLGKAAKQRRKVKEMAVTLATAGVIGYADREKGEQNTPRLVKNMTLESQLGLAAAAAYFVTGNEMLADVAEGALAVTAYKGRIKPSGTMRPPPKDASGADDSAGDVVEVGFED